MPPQEDPTEREQRVPLLNGQEREESQPFTLSPEKLAKLVDPKNPEMLREMGGTEKILKCLRTDPAVGLSSDEDLDQTKTKQPFQSRREFYGKNVCLFSSLGTLVFT